MPVTDIERYRTAQVSIPQAARLRFLTVPDMTVMRTGRILSGRETGGTGPREKNLRRGRFRSAFSLCLTFLACRHGSRRQ
ncbi:hypothetical protein NBRC3293_1413 [Gluconobacter oxydans NBRC 3293]|uniref:Uncharacterized protein n=1 Tax=Gluconobacter oxydans NBRC 3293 TaxID=1315969 RepID=A0A829X8W2_GLUOY|nr:hypothetical protein NBRC3293_1413 [Gluconobacter oxydans NBRC 3293]